MTILARALGVVFLAVIMAAMPRAAEAQPAFSKVFSPNEIGPGGTSTLTFTIDNSGGGPVSDLAFTDTLPAAVTLATPASASTTCSDATLNAPDGGTSLTFSGGRLGAGGSCTVTVNVTASTTGTHTNVTGDLTSSAGNSGTATDDLEVVTTLPGFTKAFAPASVPLGGQSTLTFTIDNSASASPVTNLDFTDNMPAGIEVASPANASTTCGDPLIPADLTATPGSNQIVLDADGTFAFPAVAAGASCTVTVDVTGAAVGRHNNTVELLANFTSAGSATAALTVTGGNPLEITKAFTDDPVAPGGTATLEFTLSNNDRTFAATDVGFSDDLDFMLTGATFTGMALTNTCGGTGTTGGTFTYSGGSIPAEGSCTIRIPVNIPVGAGPGTYDNVTTAITGTINGAPVPGGGTAADSLTVGTAQRLTFTTGFAPSTVAAGGSTDIEFTITNPNTGSGAADITFIDDLTAFLPFPVSVTLPATPCGPGSSIALIALGTDRQGLELTGGSLNAGGTAGDSCNFTVGLDIPAGMPGGTVVNTTDTLSATIAGGTVTTPGASASLTINGGAVNLTFAKAFTDDPVNAGGTATLEYTISSAAESGADATGLSFTEDLAALAPALAGATFNFPSSPDPACGAGSTVTGSAGDTLLTFAGGSVAPGSSCTFSVTINVPGGAATNDHASTSDPLSGTAAGNPVSAPGASDTLRVLGTDDQPLLFSKEFLDAPFLPGETTTLRYTIENPNATTDATITFFTDDLNGALSGLTATGGATTNTCGGALSGTTFLIYTGGAVTAGTTCEIEVDVLIPAGAGDGTYNSTSSSLSATVGGAAKTSDPAFDNLVVEAAQLEMTASFTPGTTEAGTTVQAAFTLTNPTGQTVTNLSFTGDFDAMLSGSTLAGSGPHTCNGALFGTTPGAFDYSGASLAPGASCVVRVGVATPAGAATGTYSHTVNDLTGDIGGLSVTAPNAVSTLGVTAADAPGFAKGFAGPVFAGGTASLTFTIDNSASASALTALAFSDDLDAMLSGAVFSGALSSTCGGSASGTGFVTFSGGSVAAGSSCTVTLPVNVPAGATAGSYPNTSSALNSGGLVLAPAAAASLTVESAPTFAKAFAPAMIADGATSTLTFTIDNSASSQTVTALDFTDNLPAGVVVATPANGSTTCTGGTLTAASGAAVASYTGGTVAAGASCTVQVDVTPTAPGTFNNTSGDLTSVAGNSGAASATLTATAEADLSVTISDDLDPVFPTDTLTYTVEVANAGPSDATGVSSGFTLPAGVTLVSTSGCAEDPVGVPTCTLGTIAEGGSASYTITVSVDAASTGTLSASTTVSSPVTDPAAGNNSATEDTTVTSQADVSITKTDGITSIRAGDTLTYTIVAANAGPSTDPAVLVEDIFPSNMICSYSSAATGGATGNGTGSGDPLADTLSMPSGSSVTYTASCVVDVGATGTLSNTATVTPSVNDPDAGNNTATDDDTAVVVPQITFTKAFSPAAIEQGEVTRVVISMDNSANAVSASNLTFTDNFPADMVVATPANATNSCGGTFTADAGATSVDLAGGVVAVGATCAVEVDVVVTTSDTSVTNTTTTLTSTLPDAAPASATLSVNPAGAPSFSKAFGPTTVEQGETTTLTLIIDNAANAAAADDLAFSDPFPAGMVVADPANATNTCGGTFTANAGEASVDLTGGSVIAGEGCTLEVDVRVTSGDPSVTNTTTTLSSTLPTAAAATATLNINPAGAPGFAKAFTPDTIEQGGVSTIRFDVDNGANAIAATGLSFSDPFPAGMAVAEPANVTNSCGGTFTANAGETTVSLSGGELAAGASCSIDVDVVVTSGETSVTNTTSALSSSLPTAAAASATLTLNPAAAPGFTKAFTPDTVEQGGVSTIRFAIDNTANAILAGDMAFSDPFPAGMAVADPANVTNSCGGTFTANAGETTVSLTGGELAAGASCSIDVDVVVTSGETSVTNTTSALSSTLPEAAAASATLNINPAEIPGFAKVFAPDVINQGGITTLSISIDNTANAIAAADMAFSDDFPAGLVIATPAALSNTCGGTVAATSGTAALSLANGTVAAGASCEISVSVQGLTAGTFDNTTSVLATSLGTAPAASDRLTVNAVPLTVAASFAPATIEQFQTSTLTYSFSNTATIGASAVALSDTLPAGVTIANPAQITNSCGGTLSAPGGGNAVALSGGTLAPGGSCSITVAVTSGTVGSYANTVETASSSLGNSAAASATLVVEPATTGRLTIVQNTDTDGTFVFSSTAPDLNFTINTAGGTGREGPITLAAGTYVLNQATPDGVGNTAITCSDADSIGQPRQRSLTIQLDPLEVLTCTFTSISSRQKTVDTINRFLTKRADLILSSEPSNNRRFNRLKRGVGGSTPLSFAQGNLNSFLPFTAQISTASDSYSMSTSFLQMREAAASLALAHGDQRGIRHIENYRWDAWFEAQYKKFDAGTDKGHFAIAYFGADYLVSDNLLVGAMFQIDDMEDRSTALNSSVNGTGWMVGPYMTARIAPNLYFDGRVAAGTSTNDISPFNTYTDEFTTDRWMAMAGITGEFQKGNWTIQPGASLSYFEEKQNSYIDGVGVVIPSQVVSLGQIKIGPTFTGQFQTKDGTNYAPYISLDAIYNFGDTKGVTVTNADTASTDGWRGRVQAGVDFQLQGGTSISLGGSYDGIGRDSLDIWGLSFELNIPIHKDKVK